MQTDRAESWTRRTAFGIAAAALLWRRAEAASLTFGQLYGPVRADGVQLSPTAQALVGQVVTLEGFMAPPLKAESDFFVLTRYPMSVCPFCSGSADWPLDIVYVALNQEAATIEPSYAIEATGRLEFGPRMDPATGFVSLVRLVDASWRQR